MSGEPSNGKIRIEWLILFILTLSLISVVVHAKKAEVKLGVLALRGADKAYEMWNPTADYLTAAIPGYQFTIVPVNNTDVDQILKRKELQFLLTNPAQYAQLERDIGISRIATLKNKQLGQTLAQFGAVIISRADRSDIKSVHDLKDKSFMAVHPNAFGGWWMAKREFQRLGYDPATMFSKMLWSGFPQDKIVKAVEAGEVDAGTVRTNILERMAFDGKIKLEDFRVLNSQLTMSFPFQLSTPLYPEWAFSTTPGTPSGLAQDVAVALLMLADGSSAARAAQIAGWTVPLDYQPVHELMRELEVGPYQHGWAESAKYLFAERYYILPIVFVILLLVVVLESFGLSILRRRISKLVVGADEGRLAVTSVAAESLRLSEVHSASLLKLGASTGLSASQKLTRILALGCEVFNVEAGRIDKLQENDELIVIDEYTTTQVAQNQKLGTILLEQRAEIAQFILNHDGPFIVNDVANSEFSTLLSADDDEIKSYIGVGIVINNTKYGVLSFSSHRVKASFDDWQTNLIRQFVFVVAVLIEKEMIAQQLVMLNRVAVQRKLG